MKNYWLKKEFHSCCTFEILDHKKSNLIPETIVDVDDRPNMKIIERLEVEEDGKKVWKPVLAIWEKFEATYNELNDRNHIRLLEVDGDTVGILRYYDKHGEFTESWIMHGLKLIDINFGDVIKSLTATFNFHHAVFVINKKEKYGRI